MGGRELGRAEVKGCTGALGTDPREEGGCQRELIPPLPSPPRFCKDSVLPFLLGRGHRETQVMPAGLSLPLEGL